MKRSILFLSLQSGKSGLSRGGLRHPVSERTAHLQNGRKPF
jgi:hypothetical protein